MSYLIGVGLLFEDERFNQLRELELFLAEHIGNDYALRQPPHVTVKRPIKVANSLEIEKVIKIVSDLASETGVIPIHVVGISNFSKKVLYIQIAKNEQLASIHRKLVDLFSINFENSVGELEQDKMVFHSTLATNLTNNEFALSSQLLDERNGADLQFSTVAKRIGVFLSMDDGINWIVYAQINLKKLNA